MRARPSLLAAVLLPLAAAAASGCPRTMSPIAATPTPAPAPSATATAAAWRPLPTPVLLASGETPCVSDEDCPENTSCKTPEQLRWNACGAPRVTDCGKGWIGDECGNCFLTCRTIDACPKGMWCDGTTCHSPARCTAEVPALRP